MKKIILPILILLLFTCKEKTNQTQIANNSNFSSIFTETAEEIKIANAFYKYSSSLENGTNEDIVLKVTQNETIDKTTKNIKSVYNITTVDAKWEINVEANDLEIKNNTLIAKNNAVENLEDTYSIFNLENGNHLLDYTYDKLTVRSIEGNFRRFIGFTSLLNSRDLLKSYDDKVIGVLSYASEKNEIKKILIRSELEIDSITPDLYLNSNSENTRVFEEGNILVFMDFDDDNHNKKDIDFSFGLVYYIGDEAEETYIIFEVKDDAIVEEGIQMNKNGFRIEFL